MSLAQGVGPQQGKGQGLVAVSPLGGQHPGEEVVVSPRLSVVEGEDSLLMDHTAGVIRDGPRPQPSQYS